MIDPHAPHRAALEAAGWRLTPWTLGVYVGRSGELLATPYVAPADIVAYWEGVEEGRQHAANRARHRG